MESFLSLFLRTMNVGSPRKHQDIRKYRNVLKNMLLQMLYPVVMCGLVHPERKIYPHLQHPGSTSNADKTEQFFPLMVSFIEDPESLVTFSRATIVKETRSSSNLAIW